MKTFFRIGWLGLVAVLAFALPSVLRAGESGARPIQLVGNLEAVISSQLTSLLLEKPTVKFLITVDAEGKLIDYLALEATHYELRPRAEETLRQAGFTPALAQGKPVQSSCEVTVLFFDPEQRAIRSGLITRPFGMTSTDVAARRIYEASKTRFLYRRAEIAELDQPITIREGKVMVLTDANDQPAVGECLVDFYIDTRGEVRAPRVVKSDNDTVALSALLTLQHAHYAPITRSGGVPAYVKVRQPMSFAPAAPSEPAAK